jgi:hypothetical protein
LSFGFGQVAEAGALAQVPARGHAQHYSGDSDASGEGVEFGVSGLWDAFGEFGGEDAFDFGAS